MIKSIKYILMLATLSLSIQVKAQLSATNILELQRGNLPGYEPADLYTMYDQLDLQYRYKSFRLSTRLEQFHTSVDNPYEYVRLNQFSATYRKKGLDVKLGNYYETLGRGLLLRGYEIKNSVFEDRIYRSRQGFYKDIQGASASYRIKNLSLKALWGKTLNNQLPVTHPDRRLDEVAGSEITYQFNNFSLGGIYLNHQLNDITSHFASAHVEGSILNTLSYYGELAKNVANNTTPFSFDDEDQYGIYFNLNYALPGFGLSLELKDYHHFTIGSGIADAPTLVKEQSYRLLNRSTHVAEFFDESGYQLEMFYNSSNNTFITFNHSYAKNQFGSLNFTFYEFFMEAYMPRDRWQLKTFVDFSSDEVTAEKNRIALGAYYTYLLDNGWSINLELEGQNSKRDDRRFNNGYLGIYASKSTKFSAGFQYEMTNDPYLLEEGNKLKTFPGINLSYKINHKNNIQLFAGSRRGGPACTSGICYEVLDFKGVEFRYTLKI